MSAVTAHALLRATSAPQNIDLIPHDGGIFDQIFHNTSITLQIIGWPKPPFSINLIQFIIVFVLAIAINGLTERLTGRKVSLTLAVLVTLIGSWLFETYVNLPIDFSIEHVRIIAAFLGALIIAVFYTLTVGKSGGKSSH